MKSQVIYPAMQSNVFSALCANIMQSKFMLNLADLFSCILEEKVSTTQTLHLLHAHAAFSLLILFGGTSVLVAALLFAWFALSVIQCRRSF